MAKKKKLKGRIAFQKALPLRRVPAGETLVPLRDIEIHTNPQYLTRRSWVLFGVYSGKIRLEATRIGVRLYTSKEAVDRFLDACCNHCY